LALLVVGVLGGIPDIGGGAGKNAKTSQLQTLPIGVPNYMVDCSGVKISLLNNKPDSVRINSITIDDTAALLFRLLFWQSASGKQLSVQTFMKLKRTKIMSCLSYSIIQMSPRLQPFLVRKQGNESAVHTFVFESLRQYFLRKGLRPKRWITVGADLTLRQKNSSRLLAIEVETGGAYRIDKERLIRKFGFLQSRYDVVIVLTNSYYKNGMNTFSLRFPYFFEKTPFTTFFLDKRSLAFPLPATYITVGIRGAYFGFCRRGSLKTRLYE
jgi:hypothetical protein